MAMRNFWIDADIDGRATMLSGGPRRKDGGMNIAIRMRDEGRSVVGCSIDCYECDDSLCLRVYDGNGDLVYETETER